MKMDVMLNQPLESFVRLNRASLTQFRHIGGKPVVFAAKRPVEGRAASSRPSPCRNSNAQVKFPQRPLCKVQHFARNAISQKSAALVTDTARFARANSAFACVPTVSTTARIAGKPATFLWLRAVATESKSICLLIDADPRLAAAAGGVARYLADVAGIENDAIARLQAAVVAACNESFEHLTPEHPQLEITFTRLPDRIEVALVHRGEGSPAVGLDTIAGFATTMGGTESVPGVFAGVDRVQYETHNGEAVTRLTKYIREVTPRI
jgi:hypothetical protein